MPEFDLITALFTGFVLAALFAVWRAATAIASGRFLKSIQSKIDAAVNTAVDHALEVRLRDHQAKLDKELEDHKVELQLQHTRELEAIRADVRVDAFRREDRLRHLHLKQQVVLEELFGLVQDLLATSEPVLNPTWWAGQPTKEESLQAFIAAMESFVNYTAKKRIYVPETLAARLWQLRNDLVGLRRKQIAHEESGDLREQFDLYDDWGRAAEAASREIEAEFRRLVGTLEEPPANDPQPPPKPS